MIRGRVTTLREPVIHIRVFGPDCQEEEIEAVLDTGFNDFLTLPPSLVHELQLPLAAPLLATLADGEVVEMNSYRAAVLWDGQRRDILVLACNGGALVGMSLLYGHDIWIEAVENGLVTINRRDENSR